MRKGTAIAAAVAMTLVMVSMDVGAASGASTGQIRGTVSERSGRPLTAGLLARLVNNLGGTVPGMTTTVASDGGYAFINVAPGMYTVQVVGAAGMSAVAVRAGMVSTANVTVETAPRQGLSATAKWIIAAAVAGGTVAAVIAVRRNASGSQ